jgi:hypothetical protein
MGKGDRPKSKGTRKGSNRSNNNNSDGKNKAKNTIEIDGNVINLLFPTNGNFFSTNIDQWYEKLLIVISEKYPLVSTIMSDPEAFSKAIKKMKPKAFDPPLHLDALQRKMYISFYLEDYKEFRKEKKRLDEDKIALWSLIQSTISEQSYELCRSHSGWKDSLSDSGKRNPGKFIKIIIDTHRNGIFDDYVNENTLMYRFRCNVYAVKQMPNVDLFGFFKLIESLKKRDLHMTELVNSKRTIRKIDHVIPESDYVSCFLNGVNDDHKEAVEMYERDVRFEEKQPFETVELAYGYLRTSHNIKKNELSMSSKELQAYKTSVEKLIAGDAEGALAFLTKYKGKRSSNGRKTKFQKKAKTDNVMKPTRPCRHCADLSFIPDKMHWDNDCPMKAHIEGLKGKDNNKPNPKKRKKKGNNVENDVDEDVYDDDDDDDNDGAQTYVVAKKSRKKANK